MIALQAALIVCFATAAFVLPFLTSPLYGEGPGVFMGIGLLVCHLYAVGLLVYRGYCVVQICKAKQHFTASHAVEMVVLIAVHPVLLLAAYSLNSWGFTKAAPLMPW
jgi:hypothetical protein